MTFMDGENLTIRAQAVMSPASGMPQLFEGDHYKRDVFVWLPGMVATERVSVGLIPLQPHAVRAYYYTSLVGSEAEVETVREQLWNLGFEPNVFKKQKNRDKAKGVDITLTKDMLSHAYQGNYDTAVLVAGDGDYVPLVEEVKRLGKRVHVAFFDCDGLSPQLKLAADRFNDLTSLFNRKWGRDVEKANR
jgi:hypothetical protein